MSDTRAWLVRSITGLLHCADNQVVDNATLQQLGADSLDMVELTIAIEDDFQVKIDDDEMVGIARVDQLLALIDSKVAAR